VTSAVGHVAVPQGQQAAIWVSADIADCSFLQTCDPDDILSWLVINEGKSLQYADLLTLSKLTNLQFLYLGGRYSNLTDECFEHIGKLTKLLTLSLGGCSKLTDKSFVCFR